jgi:hypothetical protein
MCPSKYITMHISMHISMHIIMRSINNATACRCRNAVNAICAHKISNSARVQQNSTRPTLSTTSPEHVHKFFY